ncbi:3-oxoadipate enol-lactonase [Methylacidimicrobium cyclopophantes]|uniref:3-oxoadipate enol-lactonase n=1 Tax=Methylacidimicrobium cyclopophantes TaxID=1041766 RepID=A0A5E6M9F3_9BACT|nr:alpha/beta fold hydrolase [Methylacidimicrobium cyclopophantes]VVM05578.1 3-oxoadipate enol-lactonase [Methylacidimicrobium cyclopophantes]
MTFSCDDATLYFTTVGMGPAMVLLHPTPVDHRFWLPVANLLASEHQVVLPDLRGHGRSTTGTGPITVEKLAADVARLLDHLGIAKAFFGGCSIGGYTLFEIWRTMPERVSGLAFCCSRPQADTEAVLARRRANIAKIREGKVREFLEEQLRTLIGATARARRPQIVAELREMMEAASPEALIAVQQGLATRPDSRATARTIRVPCCVVAGGEDSSSPPADMRLLVGEIRSGGSEAEYIEIPDAGHYAPFEQPERIAEILQRCCKAADEGRKSTRND